MTVSSFEIVAFSDDWHGLPSSCMHLLKNFLPEIPIKWVETIGLRSPRLNLYDIKRASTKIISWMRPLKTAEVQSEESLTLLNPIQIPYIRYPIIRKANAWNIVNSVNSSSPESRSMKRVVLTTWPFLSNIIGRLDESLSIYYRVDNFSEFPGVDSGLIKRLEKDLIRKVDLVVGSAHDLLSPLDCPEKCKYLPHGVDYEHFSKAFNQAKTIDTIARIAPPRIGFFGLINTWIDFGLIEQVAERNPNWSFVVIGPSQIPQNSLPNIPNIHYLGRVPYNILPEYACHFDLGIIPFKINELTKGVNPLKLMEYFALGIPVVATPLPELAQYGDLIYTGSNLEAFEAGISAALNENNYDKNAKRRLISKNSSWESRSLQLRSWIEDRI